MSLRFATYLAPAIRPVYEYVARQVGERLGIATELVVGDSFEDFASGEVDAGFICGLPYVRLASQRPPPVELLAAPVLEGDRYRGRPWYFSDVVVRRDSGIDDFGALQGRRWAFNDPDSHSGHLITLYQLLDRGKSPKHFGAVIAAGSHQRSLKMLLQGDADGAAIDSQVLTVVARADPRIEQELTVIESWGPSTIQPVVASTRLDIGLRRDLAAAIQALSDEPSAREVLDYGALSGFVAIADSEYDDIRAKLTAVEQAGQTQLLQDETG